MNNPELVSVRTCYMDTDSVTVSIKTEEIYVDIAKDVETRLDTLNYQLKGPLPKEKNRQDIGLMKVELGGKLMTEFATLTLKGCIYLIDDGDENNKVKSTNKCVKKKKT